MYMYCSSCNKIRDDGALIATKVVMRLQGVTYGHEFHAGAEHTEINVLGMPAAQG
jgi:hypothetical protein